jgi:hypothetical protein
MDRNAADSLIRKLRTFTTETLDANERTVFARLIAPGLAAAYAVEPEVQGYGFERSEPAAVLPLADALLARTDPADQPPLG